MTSQERLPDRWTTRDYPVLLATARAIDGAGKVHRAAQELAEELGLDKDDVIAAYDALVPAYLTGKPLDSLGGRIDYVITGLTERGRRAVGLWPSAESADALIEALRQAEEATDDPEEKTLIRRAAGAVGSVSRDIMVDVVAAVVARQSGLG